MRLIEIAYYQRLFIEEERSQYQGKAVVII